jgi:methyltransferase (TIGR00027 family)
MRKRNSLNSLSSVAATACWVAASRALESEADDALFNDPFARPLAGERGFAILESAAVFRKGSQRSPYVTLRTRFIDDVIHDAVTHARIRQVVLLAAGMDARAVRFDWPSELRWFEVDRSEIFALKEPVLSAAGARATCGRTIVSADLAREWVDPLTKAGFDPSKPAMFVVEGLLMYLEPGDVERLLSTLSGVAASGSRFIADVVNDAMINSTYTIEMMDMLRKMGCPWRFATSQPKEFFEQFGWRVTVRTPADPEVGRGRWPYPPVPESVPGVPRVYFVTGERE